MKDFPRTPPAEEAPADLFEQGHLWILEYVDAAPFRFQLRDSGAVRFGDDRRVFDADSIPLPYRHAVRHVREHLDRGALRDAVDDVEDVVFFARATHRRTVDYDWDEIPSVLGTEVWSATQERFLPPDSVANVYDRLGLDPVNPVAKEVRASAFDPNDYELPDSEWYDGLAAGVVVRNKTGSRAKLVAPRVADADETVTVDADAEALAREYVTDERLDALAERLAERDRPSFEALYERALQRATREANHRLFHGDRDVDVQAFQSEVSALVGQYLGA